MIKKKLTIDELDEANENLAFAEGALNIIATLTYNELIYTVDEWALTELLSEIQGRLETVGKIINRKTDSEEVSDGQKA